VRPTEFGYFVVLRSDVFKSMLVRRTRVKHFIKVNKKLWKKYNFNPKDFTQEEVYIKETQILEALKEYIPEDFL